MLAVLALMAGACASTVQYHGQQASGASGGALSVEDGANPAARGVSGDGAAAGAGATAAASGTSGEGPRVGAAGSGGVQAATASGGPVASGGSSPTGAVRATGPGITATKMFIGIWFSSQAAEGDRAIGAAGAAASYDERDVVNAVIKYPNSHGGFAGRQLEPLYYDYNVTTD